MGLHHDTDSHSNLLHALEKHCRVLSPSRHPHPQMLLIMVTHMGAPPNHNKRIINNINVPCEPNPLKAILWLATSYWKGDHSPTLLSLFGLETRIYTKGKEYNHTDAECSTHSGCE